VPQIVANVYVLVGRDREDGLTLVDTGLPYSQRRILNYIAALGYRPQALRRILITHADRDHVGSTAALKAVTGARVLAGRLEGEAMALGRETRRLNVHGWMKLALRLLRPLFVQATPAAPDEFVEPGQTLPFFGGLQVLATPGHTPGHLSFFSPCTGALFAGDSLRALGGRLRASDGPNTADEALAQESARRQLALQPRVVCPGHGAPIFL
jgi:glyoxylase-like metal-dependent hydrolase (beta-lactamase superfamily II)